jgi:hypothetical protein
MPHIVQAYPSVLGLLRTVSYGKFMTIQDGAVVMCSRLTVQTRVWYIQKVHRTGE